MGDVEGRLALRVHEHERVAVRAQDGLDTPRDVREERVRDVADDEPDRAGLATAQALGQEIGLVLELGDRVQDARPHVVTDVGVLGQDP